MKIVKKCLGALKFDASTSELEACVIKICLSPPNISVVLNTLHYFQTLPPFLNIHCFLFSAYNACWLAVTSHTAFILLILIPDWTIRIYTVKSLA